MFVDGLDIGGELDQLDVEILHNLLSSDVVDDEVCDNEAPIETAEDENDSFMIDSEALMAAISSSSSSSDSEDGDPMVDDDDAAYTPLPAFPKRKRHHSDHRPETPEHLEPQPLQQERDGRESNHQHHHRNHKQRKQEQNSYFVQLGASTVPGSPIQTTNMDRGGTTKTTTTQHRQEEEETKVEPPSAPTTTATTSQNPTMLPHPPAPHFPFQHCIPPFPNLWMPPLVPTRPANEGPYSGLLRKANQPPSLASHPAAAGLNPEVPTSHNMERPFSALLNRNTTTPYSNLVKTTPMTTVQLPPWVGPCDVLQGDSDMGLSVFSNYSGNRRYRTKVQSLLDVYRATQTAQERRELASRIFLFVKDAGGRFLKTDSSTGEWEELTKAAATKKIMNYAQMLQSKHARSTSTSNIRSSAAA